MALIFPKGDAKRSLFNNDPVTIARGRTGTDPTPQQLTRYRETLSETSPGGPQAGGSGILGTGGMHVTRRRLNSDD